MIKKEMFHSLYNELTIFFRIQNVSYINWSNPQTNIFFFFNDKIRKHYFDKNQLLKFLNINRICNQ